MENLPQNIERGSTLPAQGYVLLSEGLKCAEIEKTALIQNLRNEIKRIYFLAGQDKSLEKEALDLMAGNLVVMLERECKAATPAEVVEALKMGVVGNFGEYFGLNVVTFIKWVKEYMALEDRKKAIIENQKQVPEVKTEQQKEDALNALIPFTIEQFKKGKLPQNLGNCLYEQLVREGYIPEDYFNDFLDDAHGMIAEEVERDLKFSRLELDKAKARRLGELINKIDEDGPDHPAVIRKAQDLACIVAIKGIIKNQ